MKKGKNEGETKAAFNNCSTILSQNNSHQLLFTDAGCLKKRLLPNNSAVLIIISSSTSTSNNTVNIYHRHQQWLRHTATAYRCFLECVCRYRCGLRCGRHRRCRRLCRYGSSMQLLKRTRTKYLMSGLHLLNTTNI